MYFFYYKEAYNVNNGCNKNASLFSLKLITTGLYISKYVVIGCVVNCSEGNCECLSCMAPR